MKSLSKKIVTALTAFVLLSSQTTYVFSTPNEITAMISNHSTSTGDVSDSSMQVGSNGNAQLVWTEKSEAAPTFTDLYYFNTTTDNTVKIPNDTQFSTELFQVMTADNVTHSFWRAYNNLSGVQNIYYYNSSINITQNVSDLLVTEEDIDINTIQLGSSGNTAYISWAEKMSDPTLGTDLFLFNTSTDVTSHISDDTFNEGDVLSNLMVIDDSGTVHIVWLEPNVTAEEPTNMFYYNSLTNTKEILTPGGEFGVETVLDTISYQFDSSNNIHIIWQELFNGQTDLYYYNGATDILTLLSDYTMSDGDVDSGVIRVAPDDTVYIAWSEQSATPGEDLNIFVYNSISGLTTDLSGDVPETWGTVDRLNLEISDLGNGYLVWTENTTTPSEGTDTFVCDLATMAVTNISNLSTTQGNISDYSMTFDPYGELFVAFVEETGTTEADDMFLYSTYDATTRLITNRLGTEGAINNLIDDIPIKFDTLDDAVVVWSETSSNLLEGSSIFMYKWGTGITTSLSNLGTPRSYDQNVAIVRGNDRDSYQHVSQTSTGEIDVLWGEQKGENITESTNLYHYNSETNSTILITDEGQSNGDIYQLKYLYDYQGNIQVFWVEVAESSNEGKDLFHYDARAGLTELVSDHILTKNEVNPLDSEMLNLDSYQDRRFYVSWVENDQNTEGMDQFIYRFDQLPASNGFVINPSSPDIAINEGITNATAYNIALTEQPSNDVVVSVTSSSGSVVVNTPSLTFSSANWNTPQNVSITAIEEANLINEQNVVLTFSINDGLSDEFWTTVPNQSKQVDVTDNDTIAADFVVTPSTADTTIAEGGTSTFNIELTAQPLSNVVITVSSSDPTAVITTPSVTLTSIGWNVPEPVVITALNDSDTISEQDVVITFSVNDTSSDDAWDTAPNKTRNIDVVDNDYPIPAAPGYVVSPISPDTAISEGGTNATAYNVVLTEQPANDVVIAVSSSNPAVTVNTPAITFTNANWATPQNVSISAPEDSNRTSELNVVLTFSINDALSNDYWDAFLDETRNVDVTDNDRSSGSSHSSSRSTEEVEVVATPTPTPTVTTNIESNSCVRQLYLTKPIQFGANNNPVDVKMLEEFMNKYESANIPVDGVYSLSDLLIVRKWQEKNASDILAPWGLRKGTGYVYTLSLKKIQQIVEASCPVPKKLSCESQVSFYKPVEYGWNNNRLDVKLVEQFLNTYEDANIAVDGYYSLADRELVKKWQVKNAKDILTPWGLTKGTGYVFLSSMNKMRQIHEETCQVSNN